MVLGLFTGRRKAREPYTHAVATTSGGEQQSVRLHLALANDGGVHAVLQYRGVGDLEWQRARQTVCGLREFYLCDPPGAWTGCECQTAWEAHR